MKNTLLACALALVGAALHAQTTVRGKVIDETGFEVIGANVYFAADMTAGTITDIDGQFELATARTGGDTVVISYVSYNTERIAVALDGTTQALGEILLAEESVALADVVVVARQVTNTDRAMQTLQRKSLNTVNAVSSQAFSARGDSDAASAVGRVTGVSVEGGKYVYVRGLSDRYSKSTLNGATIPGLDPNKNTVQMDLFPTNLIDNIVVYKNFTPDLPGDFTGGLVNVRTKDFPEELTVRASASVGANTNAHFGEGYLTHPGASGDVIANGAGARAFPFDPAALPGRAQVLTNAGARASARDATLALGNELVPERGTAAPNHSLSLSLGDRKTLGGKPLGIIGGFTYSRNASGYTGGTQGRFRLTQRDAGSLNQLRLLSDDSFTDEVQLGALASATAKLNKLNKLGLNFMHNRNAQQLTRYQDGTVTDATGDRYETRTLSYTQRALTTLQLQGEHATGTDDTDLRIDYIVAATRSNMDQPDLRFINNFYSLDAAGNRVGQFVDAAEDILPTRFTRSMREDNYDAHVNVAKGFTQWGGQEATVKAGAGYILKDRTFRETTLRYNNENDGDVADYANYVTPANVVGAEGGSEGVFIGDFTDLRNQYDSDQGIAHAYLMTELPLAPRVRSVLGARVETTQLRFTSLQPRLNLDDAELIDEVDVLPSASLIYTTENELTNVRLGYSRTLARPTFREIAPVAIYDELLNQVILGNSDLNRTLIDNVDLRWETYSQGGDMLSVGGFYKQFTDPIELTINPQAANLEFQYRNVDEARVYGAELEFTKQLDAVTPGFSAGGNVTLVLSQVDIPAGELESIRALNPDFDDTRQLYGQSPYIVNAFLNYGTDAGLSASVTYNVQGDRLSLVTRGGTPFVFERPFHNLSTKVVVPAGARLKLNARAGNLLGSERRFTYEYEGVESPFQVFNPGRTFQVGASWAL